MKQKIAIIGASYLQKPLIDRAKEKGLETHVFAWAAGDVGEKAADFFYPISIVEKDTILDKCRAIGIDGICSIASDLATITVNYVASKMGLIGNDLECTAVSTNKHLMRERFYERHVPSPRSILINGINEINDLKITYPAIIKPTDRSGSRGVTLVTDPSGLESAVRAALEQGFEKAVLIEEYVDGDEYSVEYMSWQGNHTFLALTQKFTTGAPHFIEKGHLEPAIISQDKMEEIKKVVSHALKSLGIKYGASHSEIKITNKEEIKVIEIGGRMGGDLIGSDLVELSTGVDFVEEVINVSLGIPPKTDIKKTRAAGVRFIFSQEELNRVETLIRKNKNQLVRKDLREISDKMIQSSSDRFGYYLMESDNPEDLLPYMESVRL